MLMIPQKAGLSTLLWSYDPGQPGPINCTLIFVVEELAKRVSKLNFFRKTLAWKMQKFFRNRKTFASNR
jgi:hypothetical protein